MVKEAPERFANLIVKIINASLKTGIVPDIFKLAHVTPLLKKTSLDPESLNNYRPISQLPFISKVLEKVVAGLVCKYLKDNDLFENLQSAYRPGHSVETALVRVTNDIRIALDKKQMVLLVLLDLSAAFDTVDHELLLMRMSHRFGISGNVLKWFRSYLTLRSQVVVLLDSSSEQRYIECGVPQGSVLGPILFTMYTSPLGDIARRVGLSYHLYADDTQLYVAFKPGTTDQVCCQQIQDCLVAMQEWMNSNFLKLNNDKTDVILIGSRHQHSLFKMEHITLNGHDLPLSESVRDLGVILDNRLNMNDHITSVCKSANYHLRNIAKIRRYLSESDAVKVIHALVSSRIDYCNAVLAGLPNSSISRLQRVQNNAARVLARVRKYDHITPILRQYHWLPVQKRIEYKILTLVFKALHNMAPKYLQELVTVKQSTYSLRSSSSTVLYVPKSRTAYGDRAFLCVAPSFWNKLPDHIRNMHCLETFQGHVKALLFTQSY